MSAEGQICFGYTPVKTIIRRLLRREKVDARTPQASTLYRILSADPVNGVILVGALFETLGGRRGADSLMKLFGPIAEEIHFDDEIKKARNAVKGFAKTLIESDEVNGRLGQVSHLGALASLSEINATRMDYALVQSSMLLDIKKVHPGLGLGSDSAGIKYDKKLTGLEIAQGLSILMNLGHLFGTFATERALLYWITQDRREAELLSLVEPSLRDWAAKVIEERSIYRFHYVLTAVAVTSWPPSAVRSTALSILHIHNAQGDLPARIRWATRAARQLAYNRMHDLMGLGTVVNGDRDVLLANIRLAPEIGYEGEDDETALSRMMLNAFDSYHAETFFNAPGPAAVVLKHLHDFSTWWQSRRDEPLISRIAALQSQPTDWPDTVSREMPTWVRLRIPRANWIETVDRWLGKRPYETWTGADFIVTPLPDPGIDYLLVDVYADRVTPQCLFHLASLLEPLNAATWLDKEITAEKRRMWRAATLVGLAAFKDLLRDGLCAHIVPALLEENHAGYGFIARGRSGVERICELLPKVVGQRREELEGLNEYLQEIEGDLANMLWFTFLGTLHIQDETGQEVGEIDGVVAVFEEKKTSWHFLEVKGGRRSSGKNALAAAREQLEKIAGCFSASVKSSSVQEVGLTTAKVALLLRAEYGEFAFSESQSGT